MATKVSSGNVVEDAEKIIGVWQANPAFSIMSITLDEFKAATDDIRSRDAAIKARRQELTGLVDERDDKALTLSEWVSRALSGIRSNFGPDSAQYEQAGGTRKSERKTPAARAAK
jgi:hypothetical protein